MATRKSELKLTSVETMESAAECLRAVAHPARLRMLDAMLQGEFAVHEIAMLCGISPNQTCEHLRLLQARQILASRRNGRTVYYRILAPQIPGLLACIKKNCGSQPNPPRRKTKGNTR